MPSILPSALGVRREEISERRAGGGGMREEVSLLFSLPLPPYGGFVKEVE